MQLSLRISHPKTSDGNVGIIELAGRRDKINLAKEFLRQRKGAVNGHPKCSDTPAFPLK
jgi:hypothetical protein